MRGISEHTPSTVRVNNRRLLLNHFVESESLIVSQIQQDISLSKTTLMKIVDYLLERGLILESGKVSSTEVGGRKPLSYRFNADYGYCIAFHIFPDELYSVITDLRISIRAAHSEPLHPDISFEDTVRLMIRSVSILQTVIGTTVDRIIGIAVGSHGLTNYEEGTTRISPHFKNWPKEARIRDSLAQAFPQIPHIVVDNQIRFQALAEQTRGIARGLRNLVVIEAGIGLVAGIIVKDEIKRGSHSIAGEIGHMVLAPMSEEICACGAKGCFESMVSVERVLRIATTWRSRHPESILFAGDETPDMPGLFRAVEMGDRLARLLLDEVARWFAIGISNTVLMYDPDLVVLQGVYAQGGPALVDAIVKHCYELSPVLESIGVNLALSTLGKDRGVIGGASMVISRFMNALSMD